MVAILILITTLQKKRKIMKSKNPALSRITDFTRGMEMTSGTMTFQGTTNKIAILFLLTFATAVYSWTKGVAGASSLMWVGLIGGLIFAVVTIFKANWANITAPLYAAFEGLFLGAVSLYFHQLAGNIVQIAVILTFAVFAVMLLLYKAKIIQATAKFKAGVMAATGAIFVMYLVSWILGMFGVSVPFLHQAGPIGIGISLIIVVVASLNLVLDFDMIEQGVNSGAPAKMEWYAAFGLMVTLVWLYLEILRLVWMINTLFSD